MKVVFLFFIFPLIGGEKIRQCTCDELNSCKDSILEAVSPCVTQCKQESLNTNSSDIDPEAIFDCIKKSESENGSCFTVLRNEICANNPETMIDVTDTFKSGHQRTVARILQNRVQQALSESTSQFSKFISDSFGEDGKNFKTCMKSCVKDSNPLQCLKDLNCGLKKPATFNLLSSLPACKKQKEQAKQTACKCIKDAGYNNNQC